MKTYTVTPLEDLEGVEEVSRITIDSNSLYAITHNGYALLTDPEGKVVAVIDSTETW